MFWMLPLRIFVFLAGFSLVGWVLSSAVRTFVLPRSVSDRLARSVFLSVRLFFNMLMVHLPTYEQRDRVMALYAPFSLVVLPMVWLVQVIVGYMGIFWAINVAGGYELFKVSGSSLFTLGLATFDNPISIALTFSEAAIGLFLVALLISYLPTMYSAFSRREAAVCLLEVRAGSPSSATEMLVRYHRIHGLEHLSEQWRYWEAWFADIDETHTSLAAVSFFRSPQPKRSWVTAAGTVLDAAALSISTLDRPGDPSAHLCIRGGYLALKHIAELFRLPYNADPRPSDPIHISRTEFDAACELLAEAGLPLKKDLDQAWKDFAGWRANYDIPLIALAKLTMAPYSAWISDRVLQPSLLSMLEQRPPA